MPRKSRKRRAAEQREQKKDENKTKVGATLNHLNDNQTALNVAARTVLSGHLHQGDTRFQYPGVQCTFISFYALMRMHIKAPRLWNGMDIDTCVVEGNERFVIHCFENRMNPQMLLAKELPQYLTVCDHEFFCAQQEDAIKVGVLAIGESNEERITNSLSEAIEQCFDRFQSCLLICGGQTVALARHEAMYYVFDPHSRGKDGFLHPMGNAVLVSCRNISNVIEHISRLFTCSLRLSAFQQFELVPLTIWINGELASARKIDELTHKPTSCSDACEPTSDGDQASLHANKPAKLVMKLHETNKPVIGGEQTDLRVNE